MDLMSRRIIAANNKTVAERLVKAIVAFSPPRDDAEPSDRCEDGKHLSAQKV